MASCHWHGNGSHCRIIDTPGINDSQGRDVEHIEKILDCLKKGKTIDTFLLVRNGSRLKVDKSIKDMLKIYDEKKFGESFWSM